MDEKNSQQTLEDYRRLYVDGFAEDTSRYVDYFFEKKVNINTSMINDSHTSALHIVPKRLKIGANQPISLPYLVAVSTISARRGKGEIAPLIGECIAEMYADKVAFVALYPFNHEYYKRYQFITVDYTQKIENSHDICAFSREIIDKNSDNISSICLAIYQERMNSYHTYEYRDIGDMRAKIDEELADGATLELFSNLGGYRGYSLSKDGEIIEEIINHDGDKYCPTDEENVQARIVDPVVALASYDYSSSLDSDIYFRVKDNILGVHHVELSVRCGVATAREVAENDKRKGIIVHILVEQLTRMLLSGDNSERYGLERIFPKHPICLVDKY